MSDKLGGLNIDAHLYTDHYDTVDFLSHLGALMICTL